MTESTFWEDESPLIQLIVGEELKQLKDFASKSGIDFQKIICPFSPESSELRARVQSIQNKLTSEYGKIFDAGQFPYNYDGRYALLFENGLRLVVRLPFVGSEELRFPQLEIPTDLKAEKLNFESFEGDLKTEVVKRVGLTNTTTRFWEKHYEPQYETRDNGLVWISKTQISDIEGLQKLASDIVEIYDFIKQSAEKEPADIRDIYRKLKNEH